jgi:hypothetical protein
MKYRLNTQTILFNSSSAHVEAYRRSLEIRESVLEREGVNARASNRRKETFYWETPLGNGAYEVETVNVDKTNHTITYIRSEVVRAG